MQPIVQCLLFGRGWACLWRQKNRAAAIIWNILGHAVNCNNGCMELYFLKQDHHRKPGFDGEFPICLFTVDWTHTQLVVILAGGLKQGCILLVHHCLIWIWPTWPSELFFSPFGRCLLDFSLFKWFYLIIYIYIYWESLLQEMYRKSNFTLPREFFI